MNSNSSLSIPLLIVVFGSSLLVLAKVTLAPNTSINTAAPFAFPDSVLLPKWQALPSSPLDNQDIGDSKSLAGRLYQYQQDGTTLKIEMYYFANTDGDVEKFLKRRISISIPQIQQRQKDGIGYYGLFNHQQRANLSACINPAGSSTFTSRQFKHNRNVSDLSKTLIPWLLGERNLQDNRCLFVNLSIPLSQESSDIAYQKLESAWLSWYQFWNYQFSRS